MITEEQSSDKEFFLERKNKGNGKRKRIYISKERFIEIQHYIAEKMNSK